MVFDPSTIKNRKLTLENLPEGASKNDRVLALANVLLERGLATNLAAAKNLASGMVDTEEKIISEGDRRPDFSRDRAAFQRTDSQLFRAIGGVPELKLSEGLTEFVDRARRKSARVAQQVAPPVHRSPEPESREHESNVMFADAPDRRVNVAPSAPARPPEYVDSSDQWSVPQKGSSDSGYSKTQVEVSEDAVVVRHVESSPNEDVVVEQGVIAAPEPENKPQPAPEKPKDDFAKQQGIDLFDIFKSG